MLLAIAMLYFSGEEQDILYSSAQGGRGAENIVLFYRMARVGKMTIPEGAKLSVSLYDHGKDGRRAIGPTLH